MHRAEPRILKELPQRCGSLPSLCPGWCQATSRVPTANRLCGQLSPPCAPRTALRLGPAVRSHCSGMSPGGQRGDHDHQGPLGPWARANTPSQNRAHSQQEVNDMPFLSLTKTTAEELKLKN